MPNIINEEKTEHELTHSSEMSNLDSDRAIDIKISDKNVDLSRRLKRTETLMNQVEHPIIKEEDS